jgi:hypothetical protein
MEKDAVEADASFPDEEPDSFEGRRRLLGITPVSVV